MKRLLLTLLLALGLATPGLAAECAIRWESWPGGFYAMPFFLEDDACLVVMRGRTELSTVTTPDAASGTLTGTIDFADGDIVTVGAQDYLAEEDALDVAYKVAVGDSLTASLSNLCAAINAGVGEGTAYANDTEAHPDVECLSSTATTIVVQARTPGSGANVIATTVDGGNTGDATWGGGTLDDVEDPVVTISRAFVLGAIAGTFITSTVTDTEPTVEVFDADWELYWVECEGDGGCWIQVK